MTQQGADRQEEGMVDASTVVLVREKNQEPQVYLVARTSSARSFAGAHVFPGGVVDPWDKDPDLAHFSQVPETSGLEGFLGKTSVSLEVFFCALRETFEESGVLLASGLPSEGVRNLWGYRSSLVEGKVTMAQMARDEGLKLLPDQLVPYGRWITPEMARKRFDTRFFLARLPQGQEPDPDEGEVTQGLWVSPKNALEQYAQGKLNLMPPTLMTLLSLTGKGSIEDIFSVDQRESITPVLPQPHVEGDSPALLFPHDPDYGIKAFKQPPQPGRPSRVIMENDRWRACPKDD